MTTKESPVSKAAGALTGGWSDQPEVRERLRTRLRGMARTALEVRGTPVRNLDLHSVVVVSPHPDDETLGCGGTLSLLAEAGAAIRIAFVTDGSASHPNHPRLTSWKIGELRRAEALAAASALGIGASSVSFLGGQDGKLERLGPAQRESVVSQLAVLFNEARPDAILLPLRNDGSSEHNATFRMVAEAAGRLPMPRRFLEFPIWAWRNPLLLAGPLLLSRRLWRVDISSATERKAAALAAHASQVQPIPPDTRAVLDAGFVSEFLKPVEYFFER